MTALAKVREILANGEIDAFIVGSGDAHQSEYVSDNNMRRQYVSKFTGSAGTALILKESAFLWTDGRYFLQASTQLSPDWTLMKSGEKGVLELNDWLVANMKSGQTVGIDAWLLPAAQVKALEKKLKEKGIELKSIAKNPIDEVWSLDGQPSIPKEPVIFMEDAKVGQSLVAKLDNLRKDLAEVGANALVVSMLDEVCWLFNIRGSDVSYNPVVYSYAVVTTDKSYLFVDETKISVEVKKHLGDAVLIQPYDSVEEFLKSLSAQGKVWVDANQINWRLYSCLGSSVLDKTSPITMKKSVKNSAELDGMRACHLRDGVALTAFLHWLGKTVKENPFSITEYEAAEKALEFRARMEGHIGPSFDTIAGYASNGAIIHYKPEKETSAKIGDQSLFLLDSGSQYEDGTTDVTRQYTFTDLRFILFFNKY